jgi:hypothetical protein
MKMEKQVDKIGVTHTSRLVEYKELHNAEIKDWYIS